MEGKIGNFDLTYVFSHLKRDVDSRIGLQRLRLLVRRTGRLRRVFLRQQWRW